jgi:hypothetical protein
VSAVFRDGELVELLGDEPELLAVADALVATRAPRRRLRPVFLAAAVLAVAALAALAAISPWQGNPTLVDRALAAVGDQPVLHVVIATPGDQWPLVDVASGKQIERDARTEIWFDDSRDLKETVQTLDGRVLDEMLETAEGGWSREGPIITCAWIAAHPVEATKLRVSCNANMQNGTTPRHIPEKPPTLETALAGFVDRYQSALASGAAREVGRGRVDDRDVVWLALGDRERVAVDAETYKPVLVEAGGAVEFRVLTAETVGFDAALFKKPEAETPAGGVGGSSRVQAEVTPRAAAAALGGVAMWLGADWNGYELVKTTTNDIAIGYGPLSTRPADHTLGAEFVYENEAGSRFSVAETTECTINWGWTCSARDPSAPGEMLVLPPRGLLRAQELYVTIWNWPLPTRPAMLDVARALRPVTGGYGSSAAGALGGGRDYNGCTTGQVERLVRSLTVAFNAGNAAAVDRLVAREPAFQWFAMGGTSPAAQRYGKEAEDRSTLAAFVRLRHRHHERWTNVVTQGNLGIALTRQADDYHRSRNHGKGEVVCRGSVAKLIVWAL